MLGDGHTGRFNLLIVEPATLQGLKSVFPEGYDVSLRARPARLPRCMRLYFTLDGINGIIQPFL